MSFFVYAYFNPTKPSDLHECGFEPFYVGKGTTTTKGRSREFSHLKECKRGTAKPTHKNNTIKSILKVGLEPIIIKLTTVEFVEEAFALERDLITLWGRYDLGTGPLTNQTEGGDGRIGWSDAQRAAHSARLKGRPLSDAAKAKMSKTNTGRRMSLESRRKMSESQKAIWSDPVKAKNHCSHLRGKSLTPEHVARIKEGQKKFREDPKKQAQWVERQHVAQLGSVRSDDACGQMRKSSARAQPVMFQGVQYASLRHAEDITGISRKKIPTMETFERLTVRDQQMFDRLTQKSQSIVELTEEERFAKVVSSGRIAPIEFQGKWYPSLREAERSTGMSRYKVKSDPSFKKINP